jgi:quercetin dioxygenase-like cupin family protein
MSASTPTLLRPQTPTSETVAPVRVLETVPAMPARRRLSALTMLAGGLAFLAGTGLALGQFSGGDAVRSVEMAAPAPLAPVAGPLAITLSGPGDVTVLNQTYEAGKDSGWHAHPGIHAVAVLSGELTIYDEACVRHTYAAGESYVGGQLTHLVRNETALPVEMVVTYMNPAGPHDSNMRRAAPAGCVVAGS